MNNGEKPYKMPEIFAGSLSGLELDAKNLFCGEYLGLSIAEKSDDFEKLKTIKTYEEYIRDNFPSKTARKILEQSNQTNVKKVNELVAEYNAILPQIQKEKNAKLGLDILNKINEIFISQS